MDNKSSLPWPSEFDSQLLNRFLGIPEMDRFSRHWLSVQRRNLRASVTSTDLTWGASGT
jgi:hypothetical protein